MPRKRRRKPSPIPSFLLIWTSRALLMGLVIGAFLFSQVYLVYSQSLPSDKTISNWQANEATRIYDRNGKLLYEIYGDQKRIVVPSDAIAPSLKQATVAIEDARFYQHGPIDLKGITRAAVANLTHHQTVEGGSTITQQLAKNAYLSSERTLTRKLKEVLLAMKLEHHYTKDEILTLYLNQIGYGSNAYGAEAAANMYFGKSAKDLTLEQSATLAALAKAPTLLSPYGPNASDLLARRNLVLDKMVELGFIKQAQANDAKKVALEVKPPQETIQAPHFVMYVKSLLAAKYGEDALEKGGFEVTTSLDLDKQHLAEKVVSDSIPKIIQDGANNAALVAMDPKTGEIIAMVGSRDYNDQKHNGNFDVLTAMRPPGSAFKPVVYGDALDKGQAAPGSTVFDLQTNFGTDKLAYMPQNYDKKYHGPVSVRTALANSLNVPAVKEMALLGKDETLNVAQKVGISSLTQNQDVGLSLVLGGGSLQPLQLVGAYDTFANSGQFNAPQAILKITQHGRDLFSYKPASNQVFHPETAYQITSILSDDNARSMIFGHNGPLTLKDRPVAAKTGTTEDYRDAWTIGYTPSLLTGVWVGNNDFHPMKEGSAGAMAAAPIWNAFMTQALAGTPAEQFGPPPPDLKVVKVDAVTGQLPNALTRQTREDLYAPWQMPSDTTLASVKVYDCNGAIKAENKMDVVHSEKPDNPNWEKPVIAWARANGYPTSIGGDIHETCASPTPTPVQMADQNPPADVGGDNGTPPPIPEPSLPPVPTPAPIPTPVPVMTPPFPFITPQPPFPPRGPKF